MISVANHLLLLNGNNNTFALLMKIIKLFLPPMKIKFLLFIFFVLIVFKITAQDAKGTSEIKHKIGVFAPLYLDSAFNEGSYKYDNKSFPKYTLQGFDFVQGVLIAIDSFPINKAHIETFVYDTKSDSLNLSYLIDNHKLDSLDMIIGSVKDNDLTQLAAFALSKKIPFLSATYPNDGGVKLNPYYFILNTTLKTHCEAIFSYLLQNHEDSKITLVKQTGAQEDRVFSYLNNINKTDNKPLLNIKTATFDSNYNLIKFALDSTRKNIVVVGSLDEEFVKNIAFALNPLLKSYNITVIGMPNWENFNLFGKNDKNNLKDFAFIYTSPYYNNKEDNYSIVIQESYLNNFKGKPSDYTYKGFEAMYIFSRLLELYPDDFINHINDSAYKLFSNFNFHSIYSETNSSATDYKENKHLFFLQRKGGISSKAW